jgi:hypothetical protein
MKTKDSSVVSATERVKRFSDEINSMAQEVLVARSKVAQTEGEIMDIEHELELESLNAVELVKLAVLLRDARRARRRAKDTIETIDPILQRFDRCGVVRAIQDALREAEVLDKRMDSREYTPRVRTKVKEK